MEINCIYLSILFEKEDAQWRPLVYVAVHICIENTPTPKLKIIVSYFTFGNSLNMYTSL